MQSHIKYLEKATAKETRKKFNRRVAEQTEFLKREAERGRFDNSDYTVGLELEGNAVDADGNVVPLPAELFAHAPFEPESGIHTVEINTTPQSFNPEGLAAQADELEKKAIETKEFLKHHGYELILDGTWTQCDDNALKYLTEVHRESDFVFATNLRAKSRYYAIDNGILQHQNGEIHLEVPGIDRYFPSMLFECLGVAFQPHLQVPTSTVFPQYHNFAIRTMAPIVALTTNVPFLPPEVYNQVGDPIEFVDAAYHELRIPVTEQAVNVQEDYSNKKVRVPADITSIAEAIDRVANDQTYVPALQPREDESQSEFWEWDYKRQSYWRWVRPVLGGKDVTGACNENSVRLEYRALSTQPHVKDALELQALISGLLYGLVKQDHPVLNLDWEVARENFYAVVRDGLDAHIVWITEEGERTSDIDIIYKDIFSIAEDGLQQRGFSEETCNKLLEPFINRWQNHLTPSIWKKEQVRSALERGETLKSAISEMQTRYQERCTEYERFSNWPAFEQRN